MFWKFKENYEWKKDNLTITKKKRMETEKIDGNGKNKSSTNIYINKWYNRIKWSTLCRREISLWENRDPLKKREEKIKTLMGNSTGNVDKKIYETLPKW